jgi:hypothetical protein
LFEKGLAVAYAAHISIQLKIKIKKSVIDELRYLQVG